MNWKINDSLKPETSMKSTCFKYMEIEGPITKTKRIWREIADGKDVKMKNNSVKSPK